MKKSQWLRAFGISAILHVVLLTAVAYGIVASAPAETAKQYIEIELGEPPPAGQVAQAVPEPQQQAVAEQPPQSVSVARNEAAIIPLPAAPAGTTGQTAATGTGPVTGSVSAAAVRGQTGEAAGDRPYVIYGPVPKYPADARTNGWEGTVRVRILIGESGGVMDTELTGSSGHGSLDRAALEGVRIWRFKPACQAGKSVAAWVTVPVIFQLR